MIGLIAALPEEVRPLARAMRKARRERADRHGGVISGTLGGQRVVLAWAGAGAQAACRAVDAALERGANALLAIGFAGALTPGLHPGDLVLATEVVTAGGERWICDPGLLGVGYWVLGVGEGGVQAFGRSGIQVPLPTPNTQYPIPNTHLGCLLTVPHVATTAAEKRRLGEETGALAVDMESAAVARRAAEAGLPMLALRAITDAAGESLPLDFNRCIDADGQFHRARLIPMLARHPTAVGGLLRLGRHSARAGRSLAAFLTEYLPRLNSSSAFSR